MVYLPPHFEETNNDAIAGLIAANPLGMLVTLGDGGLAANHIPFLLETERGDRGSLIGHVARNNTVWHDHLKDIGAMVVFQGPTAYISPSWYETKRETHEVVPTYNYAVVHVYGKLIVHDDLKWLRGQAGKLTRAMEQDQQVPWKMADAPSGYLQGMLENIVGIEILIARIVGKFKASQNRNEADREGAIAGLRETGTDENSTMADFMDTSTS